MFFYSTNRIVGISTVSRTDHGIAQTRELQCTKIVIPQVIARGKLTYNLYNKIINGFNVRSQCDGSGTRYAVKGDTVCDHELWVVELL